MTGFHPEYSSYSLRRAASLLSMCPPTALILGSAARITPEVVRLIDGIVTERVLVSKDALAGAWRDDDGFRIS